MSDWYNMIAADRGLPTGWRWFNLRWLDGVTIVQGAVCTATYSRGKRKGQTNWSRRDRSTETEIVVTPAQIAEFQAKWTAETGLCIECVGTGKVWRRWAAVTGNEYIDCGKCGATGKAKP